MRNDVNCKDTLLNVFSRVATSFEQRVSDSRHEDLSSLSSSHRIGDISEQVNLVKMRRGCSSGRASHVASLFKQYTRIPSDVHWSAFSKCTFRQASLALEVLARYTTKRELPFRSIESNWCLRVPYLGYVLLQVQLIRVKAPFPKRGALGHLLDRRAVAIFDLHIRFQR